MAKKIGVLLSGCGVMDGSEIHEAVLTLLAIDNAGAEAVCLAPDAEQAHVVNHLTGQPAEGESRNILVEAARIARGKIKPLAEVTVDDFDALALPGGFGAAKNLCSYAFDGPAMTVNPEVEKIIVAAAAAKKPICAICIAPVLLAKILGASKVSLTIGNDEGIASHIKELGGEHVACPVKECVVDKEHLLVTTPAYMLAQGIGEAAVGIDKAIRAMIELI
jgi:enhancing lycopene biosynthesis protein 2